MLMTICFETDQAMINKFHEHIPFEDGSIEEMLNVIKLPIEVEKGVIAMKVLGTSTSPRASVFLNSFFLDNSPGQLHSFPTK